MSITPRPDSGPSAVAEGFSSPQLKHSSAQVARWRYADAQQNIDRGEQELTVRSFSPSHSGERSGRGLPSVAGVAGSNGRAWADHGKHRSAGFGLGSEMRKSTAHFASQPAKNHLSGTARHRRRRGLMFVYHETRRRS